MIYFACILKSEDEGRPASPIVKVGGIMLLWLEQDSVALAILLFGITAVELLTFTI